jgi:hypothetical protein
MSAALTPARLRVLAQRTPRATELSAKERAHQQLVVAARRGDRAAEQQVLKEIALGSASPEMTQALSIAWLRELGMPDFAVVCDHYATLLLGTDNGGDIWPDRRATIDAELRMHAADVIGRFDAYVCTRMPRDEQMQRLARAMFTPFNVFIGELLGDTGGGARNRIIVWFLNALNLDLRVEPSFPATVSSDDIVAALYRIDFWGPLAPTLADLMSGAFGAHLIASLAPGTIETLDAYASPSFDAPKKRTKAQWRAFRNLVSHELEPKGLRTAGSHA